MVSRGCFVLNNKLVFSKFYALPTSRLISLLPTDVALRFNNFNNKLIKQTRIYRVEIMINDGKITVVRARK